MKSFWSFVTKEFYHIFRDKRTMFVLFGMPVAQMLLFGFVITNELKDIKIGILDLAKDQTSKDITNKILSSGYFILDENLQSDKQIESTFKKGNVKEVIVFEQNFSENLKNKGKANIQLLADASDANTANLVVNYTSAIIQDYSGSLNKNAQRQMQIVPQVRLMFNEELKGVYLFVPGIMAMILMLISALLTSISIVREKELGTMEILLVSPLKPIQIILGKVFPYVLLSFINAVIIITLGITVFGMPLQGNIILLLAESMLFIILALSLGIFISTATNSQQTAMMISMFALMLPTILLSGFIFPIANMPAILQVLCQLMPPRWFIVIIKNIMIKGTGFYYVWFETLVLVIMTLIFIFLSYKKFKIRLE
jgi:ABC-2 type transport system permease protein